MLKVLRILNLFENCTFYLNLKYFIEYQKEILLSERNTFNNIIASDFVLVFVA